MLGDQASDTQVTLLASSERTRVASHAEVADRLQGSPEQARWLACCPAAPVWVAKAAVKPVDCMICQRPSTEAILQQIIADTVLPYSRDNVVAYNVGISYLVASAKQLALSMQTLLIASFTI